MIIVQDNYEIKRYRNEVLPILRLHMRDIDIDQYATVDQQLHQIASYRILTIGLVGMFDDIL